MKKKKDWTASVNASSEVVPQNLGLQGSVILLG